MNRVGLREPLIYLLEDFLTPAECRELIDLAEGIGFVDAPITTPRGPKMRKDIRNNTRILHEDSALAETFYRRALPELVPTWTLRKPVGFNELFRFYRYERGQRFAPHFDGAYERPTGARSEFTFLIYLNEDFGGGSTRFFNPEPISVQPRTGAALVFQHHQLHEGAEIADGIKYVLRTDVMYGGD